MKNEVAAVALVLAIIASAGAGYLGGAANQKTVTSTSVSKATTITTTATTTIITTTTSYAAVEILSMRLANHTLGSLLSLNVTFRNSGSVPISYCVNCTFRYTVDPTNAIERTPVVCYILGIPLFLNELAPGQSATLTSSSCYKYCDAVMCQFVADKFNQTGTISINVDLSWEVGSGNSTTFRDSNSSQTFVITG